MNHEEIMRELRDIHLSAPATWWPPAPGYYLVVGLFLLLGICTFFAFRLAARRRVKLLLLRELSVIEQDFKALRDNALLQASLSALFRRLAFFAQASLPKNSELDEVVPVLKKLSRDHRRLFTIVELLKQNRYQKDPPVDGDLLISLSREQIKRCRI